VPLTDTTKENLCIDSIPRYAAAIPVEINALAALERQRRNPVHLIAF
jgi:hypothetical protein